MDVNGSLACCGCRLGDEWYFGSTDAMIAHLAEHRAAGHDVPDGIEDDLRADDTENFPPSCAQGHVWGEPFHPYATMPDLQRVRCQDCSWVASWPNPSLPTRPADRSTT